MENVIRAVIKEKGVILVYLLKGVMDYARANIFND